MRYKVDTFHDEKMYKYGLTEFKEAENKESVKPTNEWFEYYQVEEDIELENPVIFHVTITHNYSDGYDCEHKDYVKTIYVQAKSYEEGIQKLRQKYQKWKGNSAFSFGRVYKDDRDPLTILLSL